MNQIDGLSPREFSVLHCNKGEYACSWYHGSWHLLKALGLVSTAAVHEQGLSRLLTLALAGVVRPRILLTGSTDETLVRLVHRVCLELGVSEQLHAVDICATPLAFMQEYARKNAIDMASCQSDILEFGAEGDFDIILTHAFMGYFNETQRSFLTKKWRQLLSDQGRIVTIQRVRPAETPGLVKFTSQQASQFVKAAVAAAEDTNLDIAKYGLADIGEVELAATEFARNFVIHAITSRSALESLFSKAELSFHVLEYHPLAKMGQLSGPSVPSDAEFAHIIAGKGRGAS